MAEISCEYKELARMMEMPWAQEVWSSNLHAPTTLTLIAILKIDRTSSAAKHRSLHHREKPESTVVGRPTSFSSNPD